MRSRFIQIISGIIAFSAVYATDVSGNISSNTTWSLANSPYVVTGNIVVSSGVTLTIEAGVTIKFNSGKSISISGTLIAIGTSNNKITFTSNITGKAAGDWGALTFSTSSVDASFDGNGDYASGSILKYCIIEYGKGVTMADATPFLFYSTLKYNNYRVINATLSGSSSGTLKIKYCDIHNNSGSDLMLINIGNSNANTEISYNNVYSNSSTGSGSSYWFHIIPYIAPIFSLYIPYNFI